MTQWRVGRYEGHANPTCPVINEACSVFFYIVSSAFFMAIYLKVHNTILCHISSHVEYAWFTSGFSLRGDKESVA